MFSDHGARSGLSAANFGEARYSRVILATFGVPARYPRAPISLLDLGMLLGFRDVSRSDPADPVVEYTNVAVPGEWGPS